MVLRRTTGYSTRAMIWLVLRQSNANKQHVTTLLEQITVERHKTASVLVNSNIQIQRFESIIFHKNIYSKDPRFSSPGHGQSLRISANPRELFWILGGWVGWSLCLRRKETKRSMPVVGTVDVVSNMVCSFRRCCLRITKTRAVHHLQLFLGHSKNMQNMPLSSQYNVVCCTCDTWHAGLQWAGDW